jgi:hypothetical protein
MHSNHTCYSTNFTANPPFKIYLERPAGRSLRVEEGVVFQNMYITKEDASQTTGH